MKAWRGSKLGKDEPIPNNQSIHVSVQPRSNHQANEQAPTHPSVVITEGGELAKWMRTQCWLKPSCVNSNHHQCPMPCPSAFHFAQFGLILRDMDFLQNNHFYYLINNFSKTDFFENYELCGWMMIWNLVLAGWLIMNDFWLKVRAFNHWIRTPDG